MLHRRPARPRSRILLGVGLTVAVLTGLTGLWATANAAGAAYFVSPTGADTNAGTSAAAPFKTVPKAQGGRYVGQASGSGTGRVTYRVPVPVAASYVLAYRVVAPSTSSDEFTYAVDGGSTRVLTVPSRPARTGRGSAAPR